MKSKSFVVDFVRVISCWCVDFACNELRRAGYVFACAVWFAFKQD